MSIHDLPLAALDGQPNVLDTARGKTTLVVNVASKCGLTPQYAQLQELYDRFDNDRFTVLGIPCNQFLEQEPGSADEISEFCSINYGVTFPLSEKIEVNGDGRHPLYQELTQVADSEGVDGDIRWNFEKFLLAGDGTVVARFAPMTAPDAPEIVAAIESQLA